MSDGVWPDVIAGVRVHVRELEEKAIQSSASLRLTGSVRRNTDITDGINDMLISNSWVTAAQQVVDVAVCFLLCHKMTPEL